MKTLEMTATVTNDRILTLKVPPDVPPGEHRIVVVIEEVPPSLNERTPKPPLNLNVLRWEAWPADCTFRREEMYGDEGR